MATVQQQRQLAILIDHHDALRPGPHSRWQAAKNKIASHFEDCLKTYDTVQVYTLTSGCSGKELDVQLDNNNGRVKQTMVAGDTPIDSFYMTKVELDKLEITHVRLICLSKAQFFWKRVCELLLTPIYDWNIETAPWSLCANGNLELPTSVEERSSDPEALSVLDRNIADFQGGRNHSCQFTDDVAVLDTAAADLRGTVNHSRCTSIAADGACPTQGKVAEGTVGPGEDLIHTQVTRYLRTLPSLLGLPEVLRSESLPGRGEGFVHGFSTRRGGVTSVPSMCAMNLVYTDKKRDSQLVVDENRRRLAVVGGFDVSDFHIVRVEHGHRVWVVGDDQPHKFDALVTDRPDVTIAAAGADCIPLLFADPTAKVIGAAHAGWKGTVERVAACVVRVMTERFGSRPEDVRVALGPGVRMGCFSVPEEDGQRFADIHPSTVAASLGPVCHVVDNVDGWKNGDLGGKTPELRKGPGLPEEGDGNTTCKADRSTRSAETKEESWPTVRPDVGTPREASQGKSVSPRTEYACQQPTPCKLRPRGSVAPRDPTLQWNFVDLQATNYHVLLQAGVKAQHIDTTTSHCTKCNPDLFFSHERDGFPFGNQIGYVCMPSDS